MLICCCRREANAGEMSAHSHHTSTRPDRGEWLLRHVAKKATKRTADGDSTAMPPITASKKPKGTSNQAKSNENTNSKYQIKATKSNLTETAVRKQEARYHRLPSQNRKQGCRKTSNKVILSRARAENKRLLSKTELPRAVLLTYN